MDDIDLREEMRQDMLREHREEEMEEIRLYEDVDYALEYFFEPGMTLEEFGDAYTRFDSYGHQLTKLDVLDYVL